MAIDPVTNEVMRRLPAALRPNPWNLQEACMALSASGWLPADIFAGIMADKPREAGHVIASARRLTQTPAPSTGEGWAFGHEPCNNPAHDTKCEICRCHKGKVDHIIPTPTPDWFQQEFAVKIKGFGAIPHE